MMRAVRKGIIWLGLLFVFASPAFSLEIKEGLIKLVLHEGTGRFSVYYLDAGGGRSYVPLLVDEDYRTSVLSIVIGNRIYRMGEAALFKEEVELTAAGAKFTWTSKNLVVTEDFSFVASKGAALADGIKISLTLSNVSDRELDIGVRYLFDTYLGEDSDAHFRTDDGDAVQKESTYAQANVPNYWVSIGEDSGRNLGLQVMTRGAQVTPPDSVVFANWKRLNDTSWTYETSSSRNFNLLPYSINDSASCQYYDPVTVPAGSARTVTLLMGNVSPSGFLPAVRGEITDILEKATSVSEVSDPALALSADIQTIDELIVKINEIIESGAASDTDLELIQRIITELKKKYQME